MVSVTIMVIYKFIYKKLKNQRSTNKIIASAKLCCFYMLHN